MPVKSNKSSIPAGPLPWPCIYFGLYGPQIVVAVLKACGDNLTRENVMKEAASIRDLKLPMLLPGVTLSTGVDDYAPIKQMQLMKFDGTTLKLFGELISGSGS